MSVPPIDPSSLFPLIVLSASLLGSGHCVSMCGGLVSATARTRSAWVAYQLARLAGYLFLGYLAGSLGERINPGVRWISLGSSILLGVGFLFAGVQVWRGQAPHFSILPASVLSRIFRFARGSAFMTGMFSAFLPCGWLHIFLLGAVATGSALRGAGFLFMFWLGTLPALAATPWIVTRVFKPLSHHAPRVAALLLLSGGLMSIGIKMVSDLSEQGSSHCSMH